MLEASQSNTLKAEGRSRPYAGRSHGASQLLQPGTLSLILPGALGAGRRHNSSPLGKAGAAGAACISHIIGAGKRTPFCLSRGAGHRIGPKGTYSSRLISILQPPLPDALLGAFSRNGSPGLFQPRITRPAPGSGPGQLNSLGLTTTALTTKNFRVHTRVPVWG